MGGNFDLSFTDGEIEAQRDNGLAQDSAPPQALGTSLWTQHMQGLPSAAFRGAHLGQWS